MKKFISRIRSLSEHAAELQKAMRSAPPKIAELREAVALTSGQLKQLKSDVEIGLSDLKADEEPRLLESLVEINASAGVFQQAGYDLAGMDMELSPVCRLIVHLNRMEDVPLSTLQSLLAANQERTVTQALLKALIQAEEMADQVDLTNLLYYKLIVNVGPVPSVRLCWRTEDEALLRELEPTQPAAAASTPTTYFSGFGQGSIFAPTARDEAGAPKTEPETQPSPPPPPEPAPAPEPQTVAASAASPAISTTRTGRKSHRSQGRDWGASALERFKKMPGVSKYDR